MVCPYCWLGSRWTGKRFVIAAEFSGKMFGLGFQASEFVLTTEVGAEVFGVARRQQEELFGQTETVGPEDLSAVASG